LDEVADMLRFLQKGGEPALHDLLFPQALIDARRVGLGPVGQMGERGEDALELLEMCVIVSPPRRELFESVAEDPWIGVRSDGQAGAGAAQDEGAVGKLELKLPR